MSKKLTTKELKCYNLNKDGRHKDKAQKKYNAYKRTHLPHNLQDILDQQEEEYINAESKSTMDIP
jgi:hypothetical protein